MSTTHFCPLLTQTLISWHMATSGQRETGETGSLVALISLSHHLAISYLPQGENSATSRVHNSAPDAVQGKLERRGQEVTLIDASLRTPHTDLAAHGREKLPTAQD